MFHSHVPLSPLPCVCSLNPICALVYIFPRPCFPVPTYSLVGMFPSTYDPLRAYLPLYLYVSCYLCALVLICFTVPIFPRTCFPVSVFLQTCFLVHICSSVHIFPRTYFSHNLCCLVPIYGYVPKCSIPMFLVIVFSLD